ncbi:hypothetical protein [Calothrix sp. NIES-2100]|uniref:hypothetical protein n=1 Tax=Calothrix sp. NIES-2100 TaxID=1954172 RepID=UPI0030DB6511
MASLARLPLGEARRSFVANASLTPEAGAQTSLHVPQQSLTGALAINFVEREKE